MFHSSFLRKFCETTTIALYDIFLPNVSTFSLIPEHHIWLESWRTTQIRHSIFRLIQKNRWQEISIYEKRRRVSKKVVFQSFKETLHCLFSFPSLLIHHKTQIIVDKYEVYIENHRKYTHCWIIHLYYRAIDFQLIS